ncbi:MAG: BREX-1 system adenine-specific DNA-methyltransferase PglX [Candidatus Reddybacter sp.]
MNTSNLKRYAPAARTAFIEAVTQRANFFGITKDSITEAIVTGGVMTINGKPFESSLRQSRDRLVQRVKTVGFEHLMEQMAYTWFNRLCAIRYMELHDYLGHGLRVLSHPTNSTGFEILELAQDVAEDLGLDRSQIIELKLAGNQDEVLYRQLLVAQCHQLHKAMPFLFESIDDETELLLPTNLTRTDSMVCALVDEIPEEEWQQVEIIGWLYQFYIAEKKDEVIGKVVKSEDIPAATQLFTPNWIVKYMVQNSLGAQWLATYPDSPLKAQMDYYIEPAEQTDEVNAQLKAITPETLNPETLTLIDPASGSGHILVEAYDLFKAIYLERGYRQRDIAQLILEKNLFGLDIDERAAQLTGFALMMKGRADDRRLFESGVKLNVMALVDSVGFDAVGLAHGVELSDYGLQQGDLTELKDLFEHATTFGSLIQVPDGLAEKLPALQLLSEATSQDLFVSEALKRLGPLVQQAELLATQYDAVVANPPYMGSKGMDQPLKQFAKDNYQSAKSDLLACFIERSLTLSMGIGRSAMVTLQNWMFLSSFQQMRQQLLREKTMLSMAQVGYNSFPSMNSKIAQATVFSLQNCAVRDYVGTYINLNDAPQAADKQQIFLGRNSDICFTVSAAEFQQIPGSPLAYWVSRKTRGIFNDEVSMGEVVSAKVGLQTSDNDRFVRYWQEVSRANTGTGIASRSMASESARKWFPFNKGGEFRKWYGNHDYVVNWEDDGRELFDFRPRSVVRNPDCYFLPSVSWSDVTSLANAFRAYPVGFIHGNTGHSVFGLSKEESLRLISMCNNKFYADITATLSPTLHFDVGYFDLLPFASRLPTDRLDVAEALIETSRIDWDSYERSWDFQSPPLISGQWTVTSEQQEGKIQDGSSTPKLSTSYTQWVKYSSKTIAEMKRLEEENNRLFIDAYGLADELTPDVPIEQITLTVNPAYRYGGKLSEDELWTRFREDSMEELVSYAIGCMMGRYSLDEPGLIYAHSGNEGFDALLEDGRYTTFPADDDGIIPLTDIEWFSDDAAHRLVEFISVAWDKVDLEENLTFLASNLSPKRNETSQQTIRRYLCDKFYKNHLQAYKKCPIYWLFSSGKQKAFQCLVYLHRYNEGTLARMRTEYVTPLTGKLDGYAEQLQNQIDAATSTAESNRFTKELAALEKKRVELREFDAKLKHYADRRIRLDLDDGVKVNYGEFGDLLAEVKTVTGKAPEKI